MTNGEPVFEQTEALELLGDDFELLVAVAEVYLQEQDEMTAALREAIAVGDAEAVGRAAHKLKGSVANFAAHSCVEAAKALETMGRSGEMEGSKQAWSELEAQLKRLTTALVGLKSEENRPTA